MKLYYLFLAIFNIILLGTRAKVQVKFVASKYNETETIFGKIKNSKVQLKCFASYPTEWVYNSESEDETFDSIWRNEWSERKLDNASGQIDQYEYSAWFQFQPYDLIIPTNLKCRGVNDGTDGVVVKLVPSEKSVQVLSFNDSSPEPVVEPKPVCEFTFFFIYVDGFGYYSRCTKTETGEELDSIRHKICDNSAAYCSNVFRNIKSLRNTCTELTTGGSERIRDADKEENWIHISDIYWGEKIPGVVICSAGKSRGAQEFFFPALETDVEKQGIRFSWNEIQPSDMIWIDPPYSNGTYYSGQKLRIACIIPNYGFAFDPVLILKKDNATLLEERHYDDNSFNATMDIVTYLVLQNGSIEITCSAPVWNSTEWGTKSVTIFVGTQIPPFFDQPIEYVRLTEGEKKQIICKPKGDPLPRFEWNLGVVTKANTKLNVTGIQQYENGTLIFLKPSEYHKGNYTCEAFNSFRGYANKTYVVTVSKQIPNPDDFQTTGDLINSVPIVVGVGIGIPVIIFLAIVYFYVRYKRLNKIMYGLTMSELLEFREGKKSIRTKVAKDGTETSTNFIDSLSYDVRFELPQSKFHVDTNHVLGSGEFGIVYKGTVRTEGKIVEAAFKTVKNGIDVTYIKSLLAELKILIHLGNHPFITNLIGAWTENLQFGEVFVAVELCEFSLLTFLRENASSFLNCVENGKIMEPVSSSSIYQSVAGSRQFSTFNLVQWGKEIATGLEFIASKKIVHGDIAGRNILLTSHLDVKICDFGLARQLVDYKYIKTEQCPLPWKWMAIESLDQMIFSTKSDIWSFGITLWEIFTIGSTPYPGFPWSTDFVSKLKEGLRLPSPPNTPKEISDLMTECCLYKPEDRPNFTRVKEILTTVQLKSTRN